MGRIDPSKSLAFNLGLCRERHPNSRLDLWLCDSIIPDVQPRTEEDHRHHLCDSFSRNAYPSCSAYILLGNHGREIGQCVLNGYVQVLFDTI